VERIRAMYGRRARGWSPLLVKVKVGEVRSALDFGPK